MTMDSRTVWFIAGIIILAVLSSSSPKIAGGFVVLLVTVLAIELARTNTL